jgi:hypothetical protein
MDEDAAALSTLHSLEARLRRIEFLLAGTSEDPAGELEAVHSSGIEQSVSSRFHALERDLKKLMAKSWTVKEILHLRMSKAPPRIGGGRGTTLTRRPSGFVQIRSTLTFSEPHIP